jgi:hypothetical protein
VYGNISKSGHGEAVWPNPPPCVNCTTVHAYSDRKCFIYLDEKAIQKPMVKDKLSFVDTWKMFLESKLKAGSQSYAFVASRS